LNYIREKIHAVGVAPTGLSRASDLQSGPALYGGYAWERRLERLVWRLFAEDGSFQTARNLEK